MTLARIAALATVMLLALPTAGYAQTVLTFEDLRPCPAPVGVYDGVDFQGQFNCYHTAQYPFTPASGSYRIYANALGGNAATFVFASPTTFDGAYFSGYGVTTAGVNNVSFTMFFNGVSVASSGALTPSGTPTFLASGYSGPVDAVTVNGQQGDYTMDDVTFHVSTVPEPSSLALTTFGLVPFGALVRRRR